MYGEVLIALLIAGGLLGTATAFLVMRSRFVGWRRLALASGAFLVGLILPLSIALGLIAYRNITDPVPNVFMQPGPVPKQ
jgi:hypothetical protein